MGELRMEFIYIVVDRGGDVYCAGDTRTIAQGIIDENCEESEDFYIERVSLYREEKKVVAK